MVLMLLTSLSLRLASFGDSAVLMDGQVSPLWRRCVVCLKKG